MPATGFRSDVMRLIVTRPEEDATPLARRLTSLGHEVVVAPLLTIRRCYEAAVAARDYQAVLITSANGARALTGRAELERLKHTPAFTVGPASTAAAGAVGFGRVEQADGDVAALVRCVEAKLRPQDGPLLYVSGAVTAGDLQSQLAAAGFEVDRLIAYEAQPVHRLDASCVAALADGSVDGVLVFSPRTAALWGARVIEEGLADQAAALVHYCLSRNVAAAVHKRLGGNVPVRVPERPDENLLVACVGVAAA